MAPQSAKAPADARAFWARMRATPRGHGYPRPGHTVRQGQRMARKTRAQAANRRAHRG